MKIKPFSPFSRICGAMLIFYGKSSILSHFRLPEEHPDALFRPEGGMLSPGNPGARLHRPAESSTLDLGIDRFPGP